MHLVVQPAAARSCQRPTFHSLVNLGESDGLISNYMKPVATVRSFQSASHLVLSVLPCSHRAVLSGERPHPQLCCAPAVMGPVVPPPH